MSDDIVADEEVMRLDCGFVVVLESVSFPWSSVFPQRNLPQEAGVCFLRVLKQRDYRFSVHFLEAASTAYLRDITSSPAFLPSPSFREIRPDIA